MATTPDTQGGVFEDIRAERVQGCLGFRAQGLGFRALGLGFRASGLGFGA